jgi:nucleotide-binding universal stress UspA family protein
VAKKPGGWQARGSGFLPHRRPWSFPLGWREYLRYFKGAELTWLSEEEARMKTRIVVGIDGSDGSTAAVRWAAAEAARRDVELRVLTAYQRQHPGLHFTAGRQTQREAEQEATAVVHAAVTEARSIAPDVEVRAVALAGYAVPVLLHAAEEAALLVVGCRGQGGLPGMPSGSVGNQVATHAKASVVVVRGRPDVDTGPVVVGVDEDSSGTIIGHAFEVAALRSAPVLAITVQSHGGTQARSARHTAEAVLGSDLDSLLDPWREKYPDVPAKREVVSGRPDKVLVERSREAQLVVVGPRRHGFEGVMLGSAGTRLVERADCPVLIART